MSPSGATGSGESVTTVETSASGAKYCVDSISLLLPLLVSLPVALVPKNWLMVPSLMPRLLRSAFTTMVKVSVARAAIAGLVQLKFAMLPTAGTLGHDQPAGVIIDWKVAVPPFCGMLKMT